MTCTHTHCCCCCCCYPSNNKQTNKIRQAQILSKNENILNLFLFVTVVHFGFEKKKIQTKAEPKWNNNKTTKKNSESWLIKFKPIISLFVFFCFSFVLNVFFCFVLFSSENGHFLIKNIFLFLARWPRIYSIPFFFYFVQILIWSSFLSVCVCVCLDSWWWWWFH